MKNEKKKKPSKSKENLLCLKRGHEVVKVKLKTFKDLKNHLNQNNDFTRF